MARSGTGVRLGGGEDRGKGEKGLLLDTAHLMSMVQSGKSNGKL